VNAAKKQLLIDAKDMKLDSFCHDILIGMEMDVSAERYIDDILSIVQQLDESTSVQYYCFPSSV